MNEWIHWIKNIILDYDYTVFSCPCNSIVILKPSDTQTQTQTEINIPEEGGGGGRGVWEHFTRPY